MKNRIEIILLVVLLSGCKLTGQQKEEVRVVNELYLNTTPGKKVILDVDMCTDVDDVCAVRVATALDDG